MNGPPPFLAGVRRRVVAPPLGAATYSDPNGFGSWSELGGGRLRFSATGFAVAATADAPAAGATLMWPATRPDGGVLGFNEICSGINSRIVQLAGVPGVATNIAVVAGICNAAMTEFAFAGIDHAVSVSRGVLRWTASTYTTGAAARAGSLGKYSTSRNVGGGVTVNLADAVGLSNINAIETATSTFVPAAANRLSFASSPSDLRYFVSFLKRGALASQPADIDIQYGFDPGGLDP